MEVFSSDAVVVVVVVIGCRSVLEIVVIVVMLVQVLYLRIDLMFAVLGLKCC